jgi:hypothetical protein
MKDCWPFGVALRGVASNRLMLRWLKTVVVSDEEKASWRRQVGIGKASASESLLKCRNWFEMASELGRVRGSRMSLADTRFWPGGARHVGGASPVCGFHVERGKANPDTATRSAWAGARGSVPSG